MYYFSVLLFDAVHTFSCCSIYWCNILCCTIFVLYYYLMLRYFHVALFNIWSGGSTHNLLDDDDYLTFLCFTLHYLILHYFKIALFDVVLFWYYTIWWLIYNGLSINMTDGPCVWRCALFLITLFELNLGLYSVHLL